MALKLDDPLESLRSDKAWTPSSTSAASSRPPASLPNPFGRATRISAQPPGCRQGMMSPATSSDAGESVPATNNPFVCNVCQKTYGRIDHLARHFRSHTNEKPFRCSECGKNFARADLLKRHASLHTAAEHSGKKRNIRASQACAACASIKVKCDQVKPCKRCRHKGLTCNIASTSSSSLGVPPDQLGPLSRDWVKTPGSDHSTDLTTSVKHFPSGADKSPATPVYRSTPSILPVIDDPLLTVFLRDVVHPSKPPACTTHPRVNVDWNQHFDLMDFSQDLSMDFNDLDAVLASDWATSWSDPNLPYPPVSDTPTNRMTSVGSTPGIDESINLGTAAYSRSAWSYIPNNEEATQDQDHALTSVLVDSHGPHKLPLPRRQPLAQPLTQQARDRVVALLLAGCDRKNYQHIVALFPSSRVLDIFLNDFLLKLEHSIDSWFHIPTFRPDETVPELLALMIAGGAILSRSSHAQKFGYAIQEKARFAISDMFGRDGSSNRTLQLMQAAEVSLDIATWSGNRRTMEMSASAALPLITMLRRSGAFRRARGQADEPSMSDSPELLEAKWKSWIRAESFKRLACHCFMQSVQISIAFQTPPLISYAEMTLELPAPQALWRATTATEWRDLYFAHGMMTGDRIPSFVSSMCDAQTMGNVRHKIDLELSLYLILLSHWCLAWEITQMTSANKAQAAVDAQWAGTSLATLKIKELHRLMDSFHVAIESWSVFVPKEVHMSAQLLRMHLSVSIEDLQLIAGKEGEEEAKRVFPSLKDWYRSPACRQAMWHAGQVLRAARRPAGRSPNASQAAATDTPWLRDFHAVALYHAGLAFWVYGLLTKAIRLEQQYMDFQQLSNAAPPVDYDGELFYLDSEEEQTVQKHQFIAFNKGRAVISAVSPYAHGPAANAIGALGTEMHDLSNRGQTWPAVVPLDEAKRVTEVVVTALATVSEPPESSHSSAAASSNRMGPQRPAMVENLIQLLRDLGEAAASV